MTDLKLITKDNKVLANSRDVANMIGKDHKILLRDIRKYIQYMGTEMNPSNFFIDSTYEDSYGRIKDCYLITKIGCDMVANKMTGKKGILFTATYVKKFEEMENSLTNINKPSYEIDDPVQRAQRWIQERKEFEALQQQRKHDEPYANFGKAVSNSRATINVGAFAKMVYDEHGIKMGRNKMFTWLRDQGYLIKQGREKNNPKQKYIEQGLFDTSVTMVSRTQGDIESVTTLITGKGQVKLTEKLLASFKQSTV